MRYVIDLLIESGGGGSGKHVLDLNEELTRRGHETRLILSMRRGDPEFATRLSNVDPSKITHIEVDRGPHPSDIRVLRKLSKLLDQSKVPRILHAHSTKGGFLGRLLRHKAAATVFTPHAYRGMDPTLTGVKRTLVRAGETFISRQYDAVIAVSPAERDYSLDLGIAPSKVVYIPNGIDTDSIAHRVAQRRTGIPSGSPKIGFVGRLVYQKHPELFLDTLKAVRDAMGDVQGIIVGDGNLRSDVGRKIHQMGLAGFVSCRGHVDAVEQLSDMDVMVHTSRYESMPYVLIEACAAGVPVVAVRNAGSAAVFGGGKELVIDHNAASLATQIVSLLKSDTKYELAKQRALTAAKRFSVSTMVDQTEKVYREVLQDSKTRSHAMAAS